MDYRPLAGISAAAVLVLLSGFTARAEDDHGNGSRVCLEFTDLRMTLEQNATDGDTEVVLFAKGQDDGLKELRVVRPDGRTVAEFRGNRRTIGLRVFALESAEPRELERVLRSFPEGTYRFAGRTVEGDCLRGSAFLSHAIAPETQILSPSEDETVPRDEVVVSWAAIPEAEVYLVEVKNEETENALLVEVPAPMTSFEVPASWLEPAVKHQVVVGVRTPSRNITNVESAFFTAAE
ncbi:MAG: hypothetical protein ACREYE_30320 [Gammaproteobacteria bacterium]